MNKGFLTRGGGLISLIIVVVISLSAWLLVSHLSTVKKVSDPDAFSSSNASSYTNIGELLNDPTSATGNTPFKFSTLKALLDKIPNSGTGDNLSARVGTLNTLLTETNSATDPVAISSAGLRANNSNKSVVVRLGGLDWIVAFISNDNAGQNVIATLWLSNSHQEAWGWSGTGGWNKTLGTYYEFENGGLYSKWSYNNTEDAIYGTSYIRIATLNNPGNGSRTYVGASSSAIIDAGDQVKILYNSTSNTGHPLALYTASNLGLTQYMTTPNQMKWQINLQDQSKGAYRGAGTNRDNSSLTAGNAYGYNNSAKSEKSNAWGDDYLWLPSKAEVGCGVSTWDNVNYDGLWEISIEERTNYDGSSGDAFLRSRNIDSGDSDDCDVAVYNGNNTSTTSYLMSNYTCAIRPAMHLNLTEIAESIKVANISFDKQGGSGGTNSSAVVGGDSFSNITVPTRTGYVFDGYYTQTNGAGTKIYNANGTPAVTTSPFIANTTLYAKWTANTYSVKYKANGGSGSMSDSTHTYDVVKNLTSNSFTRAGYTFAGWALTSTGGVAYANNQSVNNLTATNGATVTLYAKWTPITYTIQYISNGGTGTMAASSHTYDVAKNLTANSFTRTGYNFAGWALTSTGGVAYANNQSVSNLTTTNGGTVNLFAVWQVVTVTITLNNQSATSTGTTSVTATYGSALPNISPPSRTGYTFDGYYTATNGGGTKIYNADGTPAISVSNYTSGFTLYAKWTVYKTVTVTANLSAAVGKLVGGGSYPQGTTVTIEAYPAFGYVLTGWLRNEVEFAGNKQNQITFTISDDCTYTAVFDEAGVKLETFSVSATTGGIAYVVGNEASNLSDDDTITVATDICVQGYEFVGWYLDNDRTTVLSTAMSYRVKKSVAYKHILVAVYRPVSSNNVNLETDNTE